MPAHNGQLDPRLTKECTMAAIAITVCLCLPVPRAPGARNRSQINVTEAVSSPRRVAPRICRIRTISRAANVFQSFCRPALRRPFQDAFPPARRGIAVCYSCLFNVSFCSHREEKEEPRPSFSSRFPLEFLASSDFDDSDGRGSRCFCSFFLWSPFDSPPPHRFVVENIVKLRRNFPKEITLMGGRRATPKIRAAIIIAITSRSRALWDRPYILSPRLRLAERTCDLERSERRWAGGGRGEGNEKVYETRRMPAV